MSRNIKEIGKELMGKSLNSFHRKTGLTQLEENNKMQDGILNGILSQVDDAYIEKTEQSNVIHLEGSGDGVVVLDSIEGNTMVNLWKGVASLASSWIQGDLTQEITNKILTVCNLTDKKIFFELSTIDGSNTGYSRGIHVEPNSKLKVTVTSNEKKRMTQGRFSDGWLDTEVDKFKKGVLVLEGDYTDKEINYFEGLQSSFEEKVNDEGKYEIEILSNNRNLIDLYDENLLLEKDSNFKINNSNSCTVQSNREGWLSIYRIPVKKGKSYTLSANLSNGVDYPIRINDKEMTDGTRVWEINLGSLNGSGYKSRTFVATKDFVNILFYKGSTQPNCDITNIMLTPNDTNISFENKKSNKIKLLLNEPLREVGEFKDKLYVKNNRLMVERNCGEVIYDGSDDEKWTVDSQYGFNGDTSVCTGFAIKPYNIGKENGAYDGYWTELFTDRKLLCNLLPYTNVYGQKIRGINAGWSNSIFVKWDSFVTLSEFKNILKVNPLKIVYPYYTPIYEEVTNEYGEPIILEGYENGTIYIDSTIVPTTTIRYTPKMESLKTLKEVENNNIMLTNDVNDNIIPYMMDVDLMIMEKEMALMSHKNIRTIGEKDMTSMQKRTQDMLERLIKGKTLTEQECKTRVTTYLNAGKITDAQAEELMLLISEVYA